MTKKTRGMESTRAVALDAQQLRELTTRLDAVIRLLAVTMPASTTQQAKVKLLSESGLQPKEIARILGTTPNAVSVALSRMRKIEEGEGKQQTEDSTSSESTGAPL